MERKSLETINRATKTGWIKYMTMRPRYFEVLTKQKATKENIIGYWKKLRKQGMV